MHIICFKGVAIVKIVYARGTTEIAGSLTEIAKIVIDKPRREIMKTGYERKMNATEEKRKKNEMIGIFAIVEMMIDTSRRRITIKIGVFCVIK